MGYIKRADLLLKLAELGVKYDPQMTVPELRSLLPATSKVPDQMKGTSSMNQHQLRDHVKSHGIPVTGNETKGVLLRKLRDLEGPEVGSVVDTDHVVLTFGKHAGKSHLQAYTRHPDYVTWARCMASEVDCHPDLKKFVLYTYMREKEDKEPKTENHELKEPKTEIPKGVNTYKMNRDSSEEGSTKASGSRDIPSTAQLDRIENMLMSLLQEKAASAPAPNFPEDQYNVETGFKGKRSGPN